MATAKKKFKNAPLKNFNAHTHYTHFVLPANAQTSPKAKQKECNRKR
jgi:hypothetical protein